MYYLQHERPCCIYFLEYAKQNKIDYFKPISHFKKCHTFQIGIKYTILNLFTFPNLQNIIKYTSLVPVVLKQAREKKRGCSTRLGPRCDVTAKGALERLADFSIFNMAENLYIQITL
jgi:hypothetical protein